MAPAQSDLQPQSAPKATAAAQAAIGDGLVAEAQAFANELAALRQIRVAAGVGDAHERLSSVTTFRRRPPLSRRVWTRWIFPMPCLLTAPVSLA